MGAPLTTSDGQNIGALCVLDTNADRPLPTDRQKQVLIDLADVIMRELDLRAEYVNFFVLGDPDTDLCSRLVARKAKKVFLSSINHELRSPLHGLLASAELLVDDGHLTPFQDVCTRTITNCGKTLCDVIEHVLSVSDGDQQPRALEQVDLLDFVEEVLDATWAGKAKLKLKESPLEVLIKVNLTHLRHPFLIDRGELGRIIMNIFGNAIKYTSKGYLSVNVTATDPPFNSGGRRRQVVTMIFEDTGKGIDETFMCNLFTPFMQENGQCDGVGLGMSMVKQLIEKNGGTIDVKSVRGKGTTVTVTLLLVAIKPEKSLAEGQLSKEEFQSLCGLRFAIFQNVGRVSDVLYNSLIETCESVFGMNQSEIDTAELILLVDPHDLAEFRQRDLSVPIVIFAPEVPEAHPRCTMFLQVPVGPNKLGRAIKTAIEHHEQSMYSVRRSSIVHLDPISPPTSAPLKQFDPMSICSYLDAKEDTRGQSQTTASSPMSELSSFSFGRPRIEPLQTIPDETDLSTISSYSRESRPYCLCVDDNQINIRILAALLRKKGLEFDTAADGQEAVDKFISSPRPFDLTFMDINMPTLDGISATKQIREHEKEMGKPRSIIAALTGGGELDQNNIEELGLDYFFQKPVSIKQLSDFLKAHEHDFNDGSP